MVRGLVIQTRPTDGSENASNDARRKVMNDLKQKSLQNKTIDPKGLTFGFLFFPGEASSARLLRLQLKDSETGDIHVIKLAL